MRNEFNYMAAALAILLAGPVQAAPLPWTDLVVFGDSLSDGGNFGPGIVFTDGDPWTTQVGAAPARVGGLNFAFGGARAITNGDASPDFAAQRSLFGMAAPTLGADPLGVVWLGGNDLLNLAPTIDPLAAITGVALQIEAGIQELIDTTPLDRFLLVGLPDLGEIPRTIGTAAAGAASLASTVFNGALQQVAARDANRTADVTYVDIEGLFDEITSDPMSFGFTNVTGNCGQGTPAECAGFLFWDDIHPTEAAHALVADTILAAAQPAPIPLPGGVWLMLGGLGGLVLLRGRRAA
jgi:phospholipase/lecithinase/hemolysin